MEKKPDLAMRLAVRGMLQKNTIAQWQLKRLRISPALSTPTPPRSPKSGISKEVNEWWQPYKTKKPYMYGTGRWKSSVARVYPIPNGSGVITVNGREIDDYLVSETLKLIVRQPLVTTNTVSKVDVEATVKGGGVSGQAGAIRHGIARALVVLDESYRPALKAAGLLTRDPRMKERKKYGLKAARRAPQFSKR